MARSVFSFVAALLLGACASQRQLMPTPKVYALGIERPYAQSLPAELRSVDVDIMYATDRLAQPREDGRLDYGIDRDPSLAVGEAVVNIGGDATWEELAADARSGVRARTLNLGIVSVTQKARTPKGPVSYTLIDGELMLDPADEGRLEEVRAIVGEMLRGRLDAAPRKEILLFVHGVANTFDKALYTTAELWHYLGREFVPIAYSWPAGHGGALRGYTYDRESSEFTVFHFKRFLAWLASLPEVEGIHVIAHSRGTDVVSTGIRELVIEARARGEPPQKIYKLRNVVLAAPDINLEIAVQRSVREGTVWAAKRWTTYTSSRDKAIGISEWLFGGKRLGQTSLGDLLGLLAGEAGDEPIGSFLQDRDTVIEYEGKLGGQYGHSYFRDNPAVSSDLVLTVRYGLPPGAEHGRPLQHLGGIFWRIDDDYPESLKGERIPATPR